MGGLGPTEIILILAAILLIFGAKRLPEIGRSFGKGLREFKKATTELSDTLINDPPSKSPENEHNPNTHPTKNLEQQKNKPSYKENTPDNT